MTDWLILTLAAVAGVGLGIFFFGGLWWTVRRTSSTRNPALLFAGSLILRLAVTIGGFYLVADGDWQRMIACLVGFLLARWLVTRWTRPQSPDEARQEDVSWS